MKNRRLILVSLLLSGAIPILAQSERVLEKSNNLAENDPHGFAMTALSMAIVFICLLLLYVFFSIFGSIMKYRQRLKAAAERHARIVVKYGKKTQEIGHKTNVMLHDGLTTKGIDKEIYMAVIAMALKQYQEDVHDVESGIITIKPKHSNWGGPQFTPKP